MILDRDVTCPKTGVVLLRKGTELYKPTIYHLKYFGISHVYISKNKIRNNTYSPDAPSNKYFDNKKKQQMVFSKVDVVPEEELNSFSKLAYKEVYATLNNIYRERKVKTFFKELKEILDATINNLDPQMLIQIYHIDKIDNQFLSHSIKTSVLSSYIGKINNLSSDDVKNIAIASLLANIGNWDLPIEILLKNDRLTEDEQKLVSMHPAYGYFTLISEGIDSNILAAVLQHHERADGSGYPIGYFADKINFLSKIIGISDTYTALTSKRNYRNAYTRHQALEIMLSESNKFDHDILTLFISNFSFYPIGSKVILNNGEKGEILGTHARMPFRPIVKTDSSKIIDLSEKLTLYIREVI